MTELLRLDDIAWDLNSGPQFSRSRSLTVCPGQFRTCAIEFAFGESLLLRAIFGEQSFPSGEAHVLGYPLRGMSRSRRRQILQQIGVIPLKQIVSPLSLYEFTALPLQIAGSRTSQADRKVRAILAELELTVFSRNQLVQLDPARLKMAYLTQALVKAPRLILCESQGEDAESGTLMAALQRYTDHGGAVLEILDRNSVAFSEITTHAAEESTYAAG